MYMWTCVCYLSAESPLPYILVTNKDFQVGALIVFIALQIWTTLHEEPAVCALWYTCALKVRGCGCHKLQIAVSHGVKVFWMCPSHLVTIAETDRGAVGQSGVGVLNELSWIQSACVSRGMDEWPDSLSTSLLLHDFPARSPLLILLPLSFPLKLSSLPLPKSLHCVFFISLSL